MKRVLVVDDSPSLRAMVKLTLQVGGYEVKEAPDGPEALEILSTYVPELIMLDVNMPKMNGIALLSEIKKMPAHRFTPVVMLTTESSDQMMHGKKAGLKVGL